jgi:hypothetical protein
MVCPFSKGHSFDTKMMLYAKKILANEGVRVIDIAASHLSAPFFEKFGAIAIKETNDGWGPNIHRVDMALLL